jgi:peptide/nickel transport system permease protein
MKFFKPQKPGTTGTKKHVPGFSLFVIVLFIVNGIIGPRVTPHDPKLVVMSQKYQPPWFVSGGSGEYPLGTDYLGRDVLSRIIQGGQVSLAVSFTAIITGGFFGTLLGLIAGFFGGVTDKIVMRLTDAMMAIPGILLTLLLAITIGTGFGTVVIAIAFSLWPRFAKIIRGQTLSLKEKNFIIQARVMGAFRIRIIFRHLLPNQINTLIVLLIQVIGLSIMMEASLSFLGLSVQPPSPTWGGMVTEGKNTFQIAWWSSTFPAAAILLTVIAFNLFGDWIKRRLDPKGGR